MTTPDAREPADPVTAAASQDPAGQEVVELREAFAETLSALRYKFDVKARARDAIADMTGRTRARVRAALSHGGDHRKSTMDTRGPHESWHGIEAARPRSAAVMAGVLIAGVGVALVVAVVVRRRCRH